MARVLNETGHTVVWIPVRDLDIVRKVYLKGIKTIKQTFPQSSRFLPTFPAWKAQIISRKIDYKLIDSCDVIFAPMQSIAVSVIKTDKPIVYFSDATYPLMWNYYWFNVPNTDVLAFERLEKQALDHSAALVYPSRWAADSAIHYYQQCEQRVHLAFLGPNLQPETIKPHSFSFKGSLNLLFVGVDWDRKGGQIAVDACKWLNDNGVPSILHIAGINRIKQDILSLPYVKDEGFLDKNKPDDYARLVSLYEQADCFLLPTKAECAGVCFAEASAFGLPCFSFRTGGVDDYIQDQKTGRLLALGSTGEDFGATIKEALVSNELVSYSQNAVIFSKNRLNWTTWGQSIARVLEKVMANG